MKLIKDVYNKSIVFAKRAYRFSVDVVMVVKDKTSDLIYGFCKHIESITMMTLASVGVSYLLGEIAFYVALPAFFEGPLVIPVLSVMIVLGLVRLIEWRHGELIHDVV